MTDYEASLKKYRDLKGIIDTAFEEGEKIGLEKGEKVGFDKMARQIALMMKKEGEPLEKIANYTGLSQEDVNKL